MNTKGHVFEIERFAIHDGPGIRTVVFMKGCPLSCLWCSNPESQELKPEITQNPSFCIGCGSCIKACPENAISSSDEGITRDITKCTNCGKCAEACYSGALTLVGKTYTVEELVKEISVDEAFYFQSGGGVTFSGGEALMQGEFLYKAAKACRERRYHTCIETTGFASWNTISKAAPFINLFLYDFKHMDNEKHLEYTGQRNEQILENFIKLIKTGADIIARFPVIPGYNDDENNILQMISFLKKNYNKKRIDLLPYHNLGSTKYKSLGIPYELKDLVPPKEEYIENIAQIFINEGFSPRIGG